MLRTLSKINYVKRDKLFIPFFYRCKRIFINRRNIKRFSELVHLSEFGKNSSGLFHDVLNPLTSIILYLENLKKQDDECDELLENIIKSSRKLENMLMLINRYSSIQDTHKLFYIKNEVENVQELMNYKIVKNNIDLEVEIENHIEAYGSPVKFQQVILNLIQNSIDVYKEEERLNKKIIIKIYKRNTFVNVDVEDFGIGIDAEKLKYIFNPFYTTKEHGTGIGLTSTKQIIVKDFHGQISVESEVNIGTKFNIRLPINIKNFCLD